MNSAAHKVERAEREMVKRAGGKAKVEALPENVRTRWYLEAMLAMAGEAEAPAIKAEIAKTWS